ncbi:Transmembrane 9 superfamily member 2 [Polyrhizophydium stewartii]|uniref:Transmembrane 9 superfamily member n=1 Tax=Polyrhizophydium stewartii TaxID=2732419 RepID=A0ABR4N2Y8_9FUNG
MLARAVLALAAAAQAARAFYLPGVVPHDYRSGDRVELLVNALSSPETAVPYDYYFDAFHFCSPADGPRAQSESLGSILFGDRLFSSAFQLNMLSNTTCQQQCQTTIPANDAKFINAAILDKYMLNWFVDGLPAATKIREETEFYSIIGFPLGQITSEGKPVFNNHFDIFVSYHTENNEKFRVVGVQVSPRSIQSGSNGNDCQQSGAPHLLVLSEDSENHVAFSYSVNWVKSSTPWGTRWDHYLFTTDTKIHWFSVVNSATVVFLLSGMVFMILLRALRRDIARYNEIEAQQEDIQEEFGWKIVHGDVFRAPPFRMFLSVLIGHGAQLALMASVTVAFAALGFLSPSSRGSLTTVMLVFYVLFGSVAGYVSSRFYKLFGGESWRQNVVMSAFLVPGIIFVIFLILNFFLVGARSSGAVPFGTMFAVITLWFLVSAPLCLVGAYFGFKKAKIEVPVRTNQIPRQIPEQPWYLGFLPSVMLGGILPFGAVFIELYFIMSSIWSNRVYYVFGFLMLVFFILALTCSLVSILITYFQLCAENYNWWWRSFFSSASAGVYMFLHGISYYVTRMDTHDAASGTLFFGWTLVMSMLFSILTGTIGFIASFMFVRKIYSAIKVD